MVPPRDHYSLAEIDYPDGNLERLARQERHVRYSCVWCVAFRNVLHLRCLKDVSESVLLALKNK